MSRLVLCLAVMLVRIERERKVQMAPPAPDTLSFFLANGWPNSDILRPKTICTPRVIPSQNFSSLGLAISEELMNKQTHRHSDRQTDLTSCCFRGWISKAISGRDHPRSIHMVFHGGKFK